MKRLTLFMFVLIILSACVPKHIDTEQSESKVIETPEPQNEIQITASEQPKTSTDEITKLQVEAEYIDPGQSEIRVSEMLKLQKRIQDIDSELSNLIKYYRETMNKLKAERGELEKKLSVLYEIENEVQRKK